MVAGAHQLGCQLPVEVEPVALEDQAVQAVPAHHLVHGEGVLEPLPVHGVEEGEKAHVAQFMR